MATEVISLAEGSQEALDDYLEIQGWSDGLPVVAPTAARVAAMVAAGPYDGDHELGVMPPNQGVVTVEVLAVNAVMAGCRPAYFPVVVAAVEAMLEPDFNLYAVQATTHPCSPLVIVNGPIVTEIGLNARYGAFGPGFRANATIGRAIRLILLNVGGAAPGILDRSTQGQPSKYSFCVAENEAESPWEPLHVERGLRADQSAVTVVGAENPHNINDHVSTDAEGVLYTVAGSLANMGTNNAYLHGGPVLAFGPEHAAIVGGGATPMSKAAVREWVFERARVSRDIWERGGMAKMVDDPFAGIDPVPVIGAPSDLIITVIGGFGRHSCWLPTFGASTRAVTRAISS